MQKNKDKLIKCITDGFQQNRGKASFYCFNVDVIPEIIYTIVDMFTKKHHQQVFIGVDCYDTRKRIVDFFNSKSSEGKHDYNIRILSVDYINTKYSYAYKLIITIGINDRLDIIQHLNKEAGFMLSILTKNIMNNDFINGVRSILPDINTDNLDNAVKTDCIYSPVEEYRIGVELSAEDIITYNKYTEYINTSISIFGELSNIEKCKKGDLQLGISAADFRNQLAKENGWREDLDTNIEYIKQIDEIYNPNVLLERACTFYNMAKQRRDLVSDNDAKLQKILSICEENKDKRILIISKRGEFATKITKYINSNSINNILCGDYHDCLDDIVATDNNGNTILVKSGANKGKPKMLGYQAQSSLNEKRFNDGIINILSIKSSSNAKLKIACDIVIFTSPICDNIIDTKTRFVNIDFTSIPTKTYKLYCVDTVENDKINKEKEISNVTIYDDREKFISYDENLGAIIL